MAFGRDTDYLTLADALALHVAVMESTGVPAAPLRDEALLEAALMRPQMAAYYEQADLIRQSALLAVGVAQAQAFLDGNKRTAYACADAFLRLNGLAYAGDPIALGQQLEALAQREGGLEEATTRFEAWLRERIGPR